MRHQKALSRTRRPEGMTTEQWQQGLRRQFARNQNFHIEKTGNERFFSDYRVHSDSGRVYRVSIRGNKAGDNRCTCLDFRTNLLGTCKHIEYVLLSLESRRGAKKAFAQGFNPEFSEVLLRYGAEHEICFRLGAACTPALKKRALTVFDAEAGWRLRPEALSALPEFLAAALRSRHEVRWQEDVVDFIERAQLEQERKQRLGELFPQGALSPSLSSLLTVQLYPYQCEGVWFAANAGRAIIADDMGLGKTIQAIATAEIFLRHLQIERVLVVCPTSLRHQWQEEIERFTGRHVRQVAGSPKQRAESYIGPEPWKIVSYESARRDVELINSWKPDLVIADEAQRIKNWNTRIAGAMKRINSPHALVLTGTPIENRLAELLSIVQFIDQHRLGPTWRFLDRHQRTDESGQVIGYRHLDEIARTLKPILIRRRKDQVLEQLPPRRDKLFLLPLTDVQRTHHAEYAERVVQIVARWRKRGSLTDSEQKRLMAALQNMRMVCDSSYLLDTNRNDGTKIPEVLRVVAELLSEPSNRIVLFSQWLRAHALLKQGLDKAGIGHVLFHGGVPSARRAALIRRFREDPNCRVFLSTDVGGTGLNLQHASVVINLDLPWNPAVLEQRIGRVHRLGQHQPVQVMNFVAEHSIEHRLLDLLAFKRSLASGVLDDGAREVSLGGTRLTRFMQDVEKVTGGEEQDAVEDGRGRLPEVRKVKARSEPSDARTAQRGVTSPDPWRPLLELGQQLLADLAAPESSARRNELLKRDPETGEIWMRLPTPEPEAVARLADALAELLGRK